MSHKSVLCYLAVFYLELYPDNNNNNIIIIIIIMDTFQIFSSAFVAGR